MKTVDGFKNVYVIESPENKGLAKSIISGTSQVMETYDRVIVLEDDLKTTKNFLAYMNTSLDEYFNHKNVFSVSGFSFDLGTQKDERYDSYFLNRGWSWGWATWKDRWEKVDWEVKDYQDFKNNTKARKRFSLGGSDLNGMLDSQMSNKLDSWAIRWFYSQFKLEGLTLYPIHSKVYNCGFDNDATHTTGSDKRYRPNLDILASNAFKLPPATGISEFYQNRFQNKMGVYSRIRSKFETLFKKIF